MDSSEGSGTEQRGVAARSRRLGLMSLDHPRAHLVHLAGEQITFQAKAKCTLAGWKIPAGAVITVTLGRAFDPYGEGYARFGPWGDGRYTSHYVRSIAAEITYGDAVIYVATTAVV